MLGSYMILFARVCSKCGFAARPCWGGVVGSDTLKVPSPAQVEWLQPYTDAKIRELGAAGVKNLLAVPISFVSEHIETLEEIDMEYRELAMESGIQVLHWGFGPWHIFPTVIGISLIAHKAS